jgi:hypothetical protein
MWNTIVTNIKRFIDWTGIYFFNEFRPQFKPSAPAAETVKEEPKKEEPKVVTTKKTTKTRKPKTKKATKG